MTKQATKHGRRHVDYTSARKCLMPHLPVDEILNEIAQAPGDEIGSRKFESAESSAALAANAFGLFINDNAPLPALPELENYNWPAISVGLEKQLRLPWRGGRHPCFDVLVRTSDALIGIESKRYEPFRPRKTSEMSAAYDRDVWGTRMRGYQAVRDACRSTPRHFLRLDACQLVKHSLGLLSQSRRSDDQRRKPVLMYLYAEPSHWPSGKEVAATDIERHRKEIAEFHEQVHGDEVQFVPIPYKSLLFAWSNISSLRAHAADLFRWAVSL